jgi:hypothetical protein
VFAEIQGVLWQRHSKREKVGNQGETEGNSLGLHHGSNAEGEHPGRIAGLSGQKW